MPRQHPEAPHRLGAVDGLAYALVLPASRPRGGVVILHGAGSRKENHLDFAHRCAAAGLAATSTRSCPCCSAWISTARRALGSGLLLLHAEDDESVPIEQSAALHEQAAGSRFIRVPGGDHRSVQRDPALQDESLRFLLERVVPRQTRARRAFAHGRDAGPALS